MTASFGGGGFLNDGGDGGGDFNITYEGGVDFNVVTWDDYQAFLEDDTGQAIPTLRNVPTLDSGATSETTVNNPDNLGNYNQTSTTTGNGASGVATYNQGWSEGQTDYNVGATDSAVLNNFEQEAVFDYSALDANAKLDIDVQVTNDFLTATDKYDTNTAAGLRGLAIAAAKAEDLLATDAFGTGLTSGDRADLQRTIDRADAAKINIADTVDKVTNFLQVLQQSESANNEDRSVFTRADGAIIAQQFIDSLSPAEFAIVKNIPELDSALGKAQNPGSVTYGSESIGPTFLGSKIADAIELGTTLNGGPLTETQINKITDTIVDGYRILQNNDALDLDVQSPNAASGLLNNVKFTTPEGVTRSTAPEFNIADFGGDLNFDFPAIDLSAFDTTQDPTIVAGTFGDIKKAVKIGDILFDENKSTVDKTIELLRFNPKIDLIFKGYEFIKGLSDIIDETTPKEKTPVVDIEVVQALEAFGEPILLAAANSGTVSDAGTGYSFARRQSLDAFADSPPIPQSLIDQIRTEAANGPQTQAALDKILIEYPAAALAAAFPQFGNVADYEKAKEIAETTVSNNGASVGNGTTTVPTSNAGTTATPVIPPALVAQIKAEVSAGPQTQAALDVILKKYPAAALAAAYPEFGDTASFQKAKDALATTVGTAPTAVPGESVLVNGAIRKIDRGLVEGSPEWTARYTAEYQAADALSKKIFFEVAARYGLTTGIVSVPVTSADGKLTGTAIEIGPNEFVDITAQLQALAEKYGFKGYPEEYSTITVGQATTTYSTPWREVVIQAPPKATTVVTTDQGNITVDPNSEVARFIQWQASQYGLAGSETVGQAWARQGIFDPYSNPDIVKNALAQIQRANDRNDLYAQSGQTAPQTAPWNDPNWPAYQGSNKEAYNSATYALSNTEYRNKLMADNGWDLATFNSWAQRITDPDAWAAERAAYDAANGIVVGPSGSTTALSANKSTVVTSSGTNAQGFPNSTAQAVSTNLAVDANALPNVSSVASTLTGGATAAASLFAAGAAASSLIGALTAPSRVSSPYVAPAAGDLFGAVVLTPEQLLAAQQAATLLKAKDQATIQDRYNQTASGDWRVRLQLAPGADYLYKAGTPGILSPLFDTDGIIFPYTPSIETSYTANYDKYDLVHSNYRGYFYKNSAVGDINIRATFTAQDTNEADYLLAVIHFFRSVTKMFYGQDDQRGAPPPMVFLTGLGNFQFNEHPCVVSSFNYSLPSDVDYIRAGAPMNYGTSLISQRARYGSISSNPISAVITRLTSSGLNSSNPTQNIPSPGILNQSLNSLDEATYVPTKMEISIQLLPMNTRSQVSQQFSLKDFANGSLLKGGFW